MQETVKLITSLDSKKGQQNILPGAGLVAFDLDGIVEVPAEFADFLVEGIEDLSFFDKVSNIEPEEEIIPQVEEEELSKSDEETLSPQTEESDILGADEPASETTETVEVKSTSVEEIETKLKEKSFEELKEMVSQFNKEIILKSKKEAIAFLITKLV